MKEGDALKLPKGWKYDKLGNVCKTGAGGTPLKSNKHYYDSGTIPWIRSGEVDNRYITESELKITQQGLDNSSAKLFPSQTVVIAMYGATAGQVGILNFECATNQAVCGILPNKNFIPEFIYYFFLKFKKELIAQAVGNAQPNISQAKIKNTLIPIISVEEQKQIVALLDKAFTAIDQAQANIEKNIANAKELFQSKLNAIFSQKGDGSAKRADKWEEKKFKDICVLQRGFDLPKRLRKQGEHPLVSSSGIIDTHVVAKVKAPGVVTGRSGSIGNLFYIEDDFWPLNTTLYIKDFKGNFEEYVFYFIKQFDLKRFSSGAGVPTLNRNFVHDELVYSTNDIEFQKKIVNQLNSLKIEIEEIESHYQQKLTNLEDLKKSILQKAFSGELPSTGSATIQKAIETSI